MAGRSFAFLVFFIPAFFGVASITLARHVHACNKPSIHRDCPTYEQEDTESKICVKCMVHVKLKKGSRRWKKKESIPAVKLLYLYAGCLSTVLIKPYRPIISLNHPENPSQSSFQLPSSPPPTSPPQAHTPPPPSRPASTGFSTATVPSSPSTPHRPTCPLLFVASSEG